MCGIIALAFTDKEPDPAVLDRMVRRLSHRGPDAQGCVRLPGCHLGHARLSIIDLSTGDQPMRDESGRYCITFNGEIYNYQELRRELLGRGHRFLTNSDTEIIMRAFAEWGADCLHRFRGMFAFALWDDQERALFAARDIFGEKPLYYATRPDGSLLLASELKALKVSEAIGLRLDLEAIDAYLGFGYLPPDRTVYENVETLPPGHCLTWQEGRVRMQRYWRPDFHHPSRISLDDAAVRLRELLQQAVRRQMVADVPVGAFLSGGLDSSTITAFMQEQSSQPVKTFSVGFGNVINELPYAQAVASLYHTQHHEIDLGTPPVAEMLERMAEVYDEPFADSSHIPTYLMAEFARRYVKVVLSGDGGDELFGGYEWYRPLVLSEKLPASRFKWLVLRSLSKLLGHRVRSLALHSWALGMAARWPDMWTRVMMAHMHFQPEERRRLWGPRAKTVQTFVPGEYFQPPDISGPNRGFYFDLSYYLPGDILVKVDRAAMAHGLETRAPFLDRDLVEFLLSLPANLKVTGEQTKILLRKACEEYWPPAIRSRAKQGFGAPYQIWLRFSEVRRLSERVFANGSPLRRLLPGLRPEQAEKCSYQTWILLTLGLWLERQQITV